MLSAGADPYDDEGGRGAAQPLLQGRAGVDMNTRTTARVFAEGNDEQFASRTLSDMFHLMVILIGTGFILVYLADVIIPLVVAMFFLFLFRPLTDKTERILSQCCCICCVSREVLKENRGKRCCRCCGKMTAADGIADFEDSRYSGLDGDEEGKLGEGVVAKTGSSGREGGRSASMGDRIRGRVGQWWRNLMNGPRLIGVFVSLFLALVVLSGGVFIITSSISNMQDSGKLEAYENQYEKLENKTVRWITNSLHMDGEAVFMSFRKSDFLTALAGKTMASIATFTASTFLVIVFLAFLLVTDEVSSRRGVEGTLREEVNEGITQYLLLKTKICGLASVLVWVILGLMHIPLAALFALLSFVLNFVPNIGPVISTWLPLPIVVLDPALNRTQVILSIVLPGFVHLVVGNVLEPALFYQNRDINLHPVVLMFSLCFWYIMWGAVGAVLAVPLTTVIKVLANTLKSEHRFAFFLARLLDGNVG